MTEQGPDASKREMRDLINEALAQAGLDETRPVKAARYAAELEAHLQNRPERGECQLEWLRKRLRLAGAQFVFDTDYQSMRIAMALLNRSDFAQFSQVMAMAALTNKVNRDDAAGVITNLADQAVMFTIATTTLSMLEVDHERTGKCSCVDIEDASVWVGKIPDYADLIGD